MGRLEGGRVFVTNGPLLRPMVEGQPPGYVFHIDGSELAHARNRPQPGHARAGRISAIIKNGEVEAEVRLAELEEAKGRLPPLDFDDSGWFLVRAVTNNPKTLPIRLQRPVLRREGRPAARQPRQRAVLPRLDRRRRSTNPQAMPDLDDCQSRVAASRARVCPRILRETARDRQRRLIRRRISARPKFTTTAPSCRRPDRSCLLDDIHRLSAPFGIARTLLALQDRHLLDSR